MSGRRLTAAEAREAEYWATERTEVLADLVAALQATEVWFANPDLHSWDAEAVVIEKVRAALARAARAKAGGV